MGRKSAVSTCLSLFFVALISFPASIFAVLQFTPDVTGINGFDQVDKVTWTDSKGRVREAYFAKSIPGAPSVRGYITRFVYRTATETVTCNEPSAATDLSGLCYTVNHNSYTGQGNGGWTIGKEEGSNFTQTPIFQGDNHLIYRVTYDQLGSAGEKSYKVTVDWVFSEGLDFFNYALTYNCNGQTFGDDTRAPYSEFNWDGDNNTYNAISGESYGDSKVYMVPSIDATTPGNSAYTYGGTNTIPYVWEWLNTPSREAGCVQTQTNTQHAGGGGSGIGASGTLGSISVPGMAYQLNGYQGFWGNRLTWGEPYGSLCPYQNYTVSVMLDQKSDNGVDNLIKETERIHNGTVAFSATVGTLTASGPAGSGNPGTATYSPAGYNHVYRTWNINAGTGGAASFNFNVSSGSYTNPVFVIKGYSSVNPPAAITKNGTPLVAGTGYAASVNDAASECWITILSSCTGNNAFVVTPGAGSGLRLTNFTAAPATVVNTAATNVVFTATVEAVGGSVSGVTLDLTALGGGAAVAMTAGANNTYSYTYSVAAATVAGAKTVTIKATDSNANQKTATATVTVQNEETTLDLYSDVSLYNTGIGWCNDGAGNVSTATEVTTGAYEGTNCYDFSYTVGGWYAGFGLTWDNWATTIPATGYEKLRFWYKGPASGLQLTVTVAFSDTTVYKNVSASFSPTTAWTQGSINLPAGITTSISGINYVVGGAATAPAGHFYLDLVQLVTRGGASAVPRRSLTASVSPAGNMLRNISLSGSNKLNITAAGQGVLAVYDLKGMVVGGKKITAAMGECVSLNVGAAGTYFVTFAGSKGLETRTIIIR